TTLPVDAAPGPGLAAMALPDTPTAAAAALVEGFQMAALSTPVRASPPINNDPAAFAAAAAAATAAPPQLQLSHLNPTSTATIHMHGPPPAHLPSTHPASTLAAMAAPLSAALAVPAPLVLLPDAQTLAQQVDMAAVAAAVAGGLGMAPAPLPGTPVGTPSMQAFQAQQQADDLFALHQAGLVADMGAGMPLVAASQTHSRRTSVIDAMVAAYPAGALGGAAPHVMQGPPAAGTGTATSASASAVPSPYATPSIAATGGPMPVGHQRQLSGIPPAVMHGQPAGLVPMDSPAMLATGPHTLAAGTPTSFGQLPFQMGGPHHGHSRHLSLDMANIRLMAAEAASLQGMPLHGPVPGHSAQMVNALQLETAAHHHQLQQQLQNIQQLQQLQQFQMHPKCGPLTIRTTPATPRTPMPGGMFMGPLAPASLDDSLAQQQQQQQLLAQSEAPRPLFMHHNSSSVDLGSIASTFSVPQFHPALSGHMSPVGPYPGMPGMLPQPFYPPQA
ncbi:hypothetical protein IWQ56_005268, partial [Coemansia nantahalensis]